MKPSFFTSVEELHHWLLQHHQQANELWLGIYKKEAGIASVTFQEAGNEMLCFGWSEGIRKSLDDQSYVIRYTPRKPGGIWSAGNIKRIKELTRLGLMHPSGIKAFESRDKQKTNQYSYEQQHVAFTPGELKKFKANKVAWAYFQQQTPSYQRTATWWVIQVKQQTTRLNRFNQLLLDSEEGNKIKPLRYKPSRS